MSLARVTQSTVFRELTASVARLQRQLAEAQAEVSSQKKLRSASDDPAGSATANRLRGESSALEALDSGVGFGTAVLSAEDSALNQADALLARVSELAAEMTNGLTSPEARVQASAEVEQLERELVALANTSVAGRHVFGGLATGTPPFVGLDDPGFDPATAYGGPTAPFRLPVGSGETVALTTRGDQVFGAALTALDDMRQTLATGASPDASVDAVANAAAVIREERASVGGRLARLQDRSEQLGRLTDTAKTLLSGIEDADLTAAISRLVQLQSALQATLAAGSSLQASILDYLQP